MTTVRTVALAGLAAALGTAAAWSPAAGQTNDLPGGFPRPATSEPAAGTAAPAPGYPAAMGQGLVGVVGTPQGQGQVSRLARQYVKATRDDEKRDIKKKLTDLLGQQFDQLAEQQTKELAALEKQVADLKATLEKRRDNRDTIIDRRLDQVVREAEGLGWGIHGGPPQGTPYYVPQANGALQRQ